MTVIFALNLSRRDLKKFLTNFRVRDRLTKIKARINYIHQFCMKFSKSFMITNPNGLKPRCQNLKLGHFNGNGSFMSHLEDVSSFPSWGTSSNPMKFIYSNGIEDWIHGSSIILTSFLFTSIPFQFRLDNICWSTFFTQNLRWRPTKFNDILIQWE